METTEWFEKSANQLWQGKILDIEKTLQIVNAFVDEIVCQVNTMKNRGVDFPMEYVKMAMGNLYAAIESRDTYRLADNLYYEWREISLVLGEIKAEFGED